MFRTSLTMDGMEILNKEKSPSNCSNRLDMLETFSWTSVKPSPKVRNWLRKSSKTAVNSRSRECSGPIGGVGFLTIVMESYHMVVTQSIRLAISPPRGWRQIKKNLPKDGSRL